MSRIYNESTGLGPALSTADDDVPNDCEKFQTTCAIGENHETSENVCISTRKFATNLTPPSSNFLYSLMPETNISSENWLNPVREMKAWNICDYE